jgi:hypothetical protein
VLEGARGAAVAGGVAAWAALAAGMGPLAADRAGRALESAVAAAPGPVIMTASIGTGDALLELLGAGRPSAALLDGLGAATADEGRIQIHLRPPPLRGL